MELKNDFVVDRPVSETWKILTNLELIAPCLPGAKLEEVEGDEYRGSVSVKVGPITGKYKGKASFVEQDETNRVAKLKAEGRDPRQGNANALITAAMVPAGADGNQTRVDLTTDLGLSGKIASFARGNLEDVSRKLLTQFAVNLEAMLAEQPDAAAGTGVAAGAPSGTPEAESAAAAVPAEAVSAPDTATAASTTVGTTGPAETTPGSITEPGGSAQAPTPPPQPTVRKIEGPEAKPVDLLAVSGADTMAKKLAPVVGAVVLLLLIRWLLRRR
jgi:carbon monoxide dehydrogenase subunit G